MKDCDAVLSAADCVELLMSNAEGPLRSRGINIQGDCLISAALHAIGDPVQIFNARPVNHPGDERFANKPIEFCI